MTANYDWHDEAFMEKVTTWGHDGDAEEKAETWFKVSYVNDEYDDCEFFTSIEEAEAFAEQMAGDGYECRIEEDRE